MEIVHLYFSHNPPPPPPTLRRVAVISSSLFVLFVGFTALPGSGVFGCFHSDDSRCDIQCGEFAWRLQVGRQHYSEQLQVSREILEYIVWMYFDWYDNMKLAWQALRVVKEEEEGRRLWGWPDNSRVVSGRRSMNEGIFLSLTPGAPLVIPFVQFSLFLIPLECLSVTINSSTVIWNAKFREQTKNLNKWHGARFSISPVSRPLSQVESANHVSYLLSE